MIELHWKTLFDDSPLPFFILQEGFLRLCNDKMSVISGHSARELVDFPFLKLIFHDDKPMVVNKILYFQPGEDNLQRYEFRLITSRGEILNVQGHFSRVSFKGLWAILGQIIDITDHKQAEQEQKNSEERLRVLFEYAPDAYYLNDLMGNFIDGNKMVEELVGFKRDELVGKNFTKLVPVTLVPRTAKMLAQNIIGKPTGPHELVFNHKNGSKVEVEVRNFQVKLSDKTLVLGIARDISQRKQTEEALRLSEERFAKAFNASPCPMAILSEQGVFLDVNDYFLGLTGYNRSEIMDLAASDFNVYGTSEDFTQLQDYLVHEGSIRDKEILINTKTGEQRVVLLSADKMELGGTCCFITVLSDITERKKAEDQLKYLSLHDALTGLYNRTYFEQEMHRVEGGRFHPVGIIIADVNGLKLVNDTLGHDAGDTLLVSAAEVLRDSFRDEDMVARIGGDEFAIMLPNCDLQAVESGCQRIRKAIDYYNNQNPKIMLSISLGFAVSSTPQAKMLELFKEADNKMYREKLHSGQQGRLAIVQTLMKSLAIRDFITDGHAERLHNIVTVVAEDIGLPDTRLSYLQLLAQFHDIGKVGIPDKILFKPGPLTLEESNEMRRHCEIGHRIAKSSPDLAPIADWILMHHEWWNGNGFPLGLKGEEIPPECRILSIADAYDAMTTSRPYREPISPDAAVAEIKRCAGTQFDPGLVRVFTYITTKAKRK